MTIIDPIPVGFWKSNGKARGFSEAIGGGLLGVLAAALLEGSLEAHLPNVFDCVEPGWDPREREKVLQHVSDPRYRSTAYMGFATCRICGKNNGSADFSDGWYRWPEGFGHYISQHAVKPPQAFITHVLRARR